MRSSPRVYTIVLFSAESGLNGDGVRVLSVKDRSITARTSHHGKATRSLEAGSGKVRKEVLCLLHYGNQDCGVGGGGRTICRVIARPLCVGDLLGLQLLHMQSVVS